MFSSEKKKAQAEEWFVEASLLILTCEGNAITSCSMREPWMAADFQLTEPSFLCLWYRQCSDCALRGRGQDFRAIPQWGAADAEIKVPSGKNTELKRSPLKAWSRSVYGHTRYAYCQGFLPCLFLPFGSIHLHFFQNLSWFFLCWLWLTPVPV